MAEDVHDKYIQLGESATLPGNLLKKVQEDNEKTPKSKCIRGHITPTPNQTFLKTSSSKATHFNISQSPSCKAQFSTPKFVTPAVKQNTDSSSNNEHEFSIANPFENHSTIDSLLHPSFSPSVFASVSNHTSQDTTNQSPSSFWNIDQIAIMKPADIDLSKLHEQQNFAKLDPVTEQKAQKAIDHFFASHINISSPWSSSENPHYLAIISPALPSSAARRYRLSNKENIISWPQSPKENSPGLLQGARPIHPKTDASRTVATQTAITIPSSVNLEAVLQKYYTYGDTSSQENTNSQGNELLSNSSLRRKLFFHDVDDNDDSMNDLSTNNLHQACVNPISHHLSEELDAFPMSGDSQPDCEKHPFAKQNTMTPSLKSVSFPCDTPSTCQSPFSSSPVTGGRMFDLGTPTHHTDFYNVKNSYKNFSPCSPIQLPEKKEKDKKIFLTRKVEVTHGQKEAVMGNSMGITPIKPRQHDEEVCENTETHVPGNHTPINHSPFHGH
ncbi:unnamed protein product [Clavelina lepadiformis]|uniref:Protein aurora borealis n=1 Tax=Clavelina lepadiformis TaxID=159417 RepID=A0ABP0F694_CLALP